MGMSGLGRIGKRRVEKGSSATVPLNWKVLGTPLQHCHFIFFIFENVLFIHFLV